MYNSYLLLTEPGVVVISIHCDIYSKFLNLVQDIKDNLTPEALHGAQL